jgi:nitrogen fixation protein NifU and related proteins
MTDNQLMESVLSEEEELYKENVMDHYKNPRNKSIIAHTHTHSEHNPLCGDEITLYINVEEGKISDVSFQGDGCAISQASVSLLTEHIKGKSLQKVKKLAPWDVYNLLGIKISHTRSKCALLGLKVLEGIN